MYSGRQKSARSRFSASPVFPGLVFDLLRQVRTDLGPHGAGQLQVVGILERPLLPLGQFGEKDFLRGSERVKILDSESTSKSSKDIL